MYSTKPNSIRTGGVCSETASYTNRHKRSNHIFAFILVHIRNSKRNKKRSLFDWSGQLLGTVHSNNPVNSPMDIFNISALLVGMV